MKYRALVISGKKKVAVETKETQELQPGWVRVRLGAGGICGSDMHYYHDFGNVGFPLLNPVVMGHEASGTIDAVGPGVENLKPGDKVAVNPVMNCGFCLPCRQGFANRCEHKRFPGSAMTIPHVDGFFREYFETQARLCVKVPDDTDLYRLAFAEPLACSMHAVGKLGDLVGKTVLVTGSGPIGVLAAAAAKTAGAGCVVITDVADEPLATALKMGADVAVNIAGVKLEDELKKIGPVDRAVEASGAPSATVDCMRAIRKGGKMVQLGTSPGGDIPVPWVMFQSKEIDVFGSSQFNTEYDTAVSLILNGVIDPLPMLTRQFPFEEADEAFAFAGDRKASMKVQFIP